MKRRIDLVREFRALVDEKSKESWGAIISKASEQSGTVSPDDSHSILVSLAKGLKQNSSGKRAVHPVRAAPLALDLLGNILDSSAVPFRTKAGAFGLVSRLGIDFASHLPTNSRKKHLDDLRAKFIKTCEDSLDSELDPQTVGFTCEAAGFFSLYAPELTEIVEENIRNRGGSFNALAVVQVSQYLSSVGFTDQDVWSILVERTVNDLGHFTPQNLASLLKVVPGEMMATNDMDRVYEYLSMQTGKMRLSDCIAIMEYVARNRSFIEASDSAAHLMYALQRRAKIVILTSPVKLPVTDISRITGALSSLQLLSPQSTRPLIHSAFLSPKLLGNS